MVSVTLVSDLVVHNNRHGLHEEEPKLVEVSDAYKLQKRWDLKLISFSTNRQREYGVVPEHEHP